ncbi:MAG TPA: hypothetical protein VFH11_14650 [Gemmatimonadota bacterium]|nr:hypothetical protein [Gemmatimonadota bacterium]
MSLATWLRRRYEESETPFGWIRRLLCEHEWREMFDYEGEPVRHCPRCHSIQWLEEPEED